MTVAEESGAAPEPGQDRLLTLPNVITLVRLACLPLFLYLLFGRENRAAAQVKPEDLSGLGKIGPPGGGSSTGAGPRPGKDS